MSALRLAILCSGQAGQRREMLDDLFAAPDLGTLRRLAGNLLGEDVEVWWRNLDDQALFANQNAQFSIALHQIAVWQRISALVPPPSLIAGYSLGELIAYHVAGAIDAAATLRLVQRRARLMDEAASGLSTAGGCMLLWRGRMSPSVLAARDRAIAENGIDIAIVRRTGEQVLAGPADAIDRLLADPAITNPNLVRLTVSTPSHSCYLAAASAAFRTVLAESSLAPPPVPVLAGIDATRVRTREQAFEALSRQIATPLRWDRCMAALDEAGITTVIELGPGNDLAKLIEAEHPRIAARSVDEFRNWRSLADWLATRSG